MKLEILLIALLCTVKATTKVNGSLLKIEEEGSGNDNSEPLKKSIEKIESKIDGTFLKKQVDDTDSSNGSGDDDDDRDNNKDDGSGGSGDGFSGSGKQPIIVKVKTTFPPSIKQTTDRKNQTSMIDVINTGIVKTTTTTTATEKATSVVDITTIPTRKASTAITDATAKKSTEQEHIAIVENDPTDTDTDGVEVTPLPGGDMPSPQYAVGGEKSKTANFTVAIVVGVIVGAILSILIIVFLVYRLRKKDEGSYSLDEPSSAMLRADTDSPPPKGKGEYYA